MSGLKKLRGQEVNGKTVFLQMTFMSTQLMQEYLKMHPMKKLKLELTGVWLIQQII